jgi:hypothetical protein
MKIKLELVNPGEIKRKIVKELASEVRQRIASNNLATKIENGASSTIQKYLWNSPTTRELLSGGPLQGELGVPDSQKGIFESILHSIIDNVKVDVKFKSLTTKIDLKITVSFPSDFSAYKAVGTYTTEKGRVIPWFEWLTELGDRVIVRDFISEGGHPKQSRTGDMIMVKGGGWRVPPQHAGSPGDNFITKAVDASLLEVTADISRILKRAF